jgi:predicted dehydrogenase
MNESKIRVGLVGLGQVSVPHEQGYERLGELAQITAICDANEELAKSRAAPHKAKVYRDYRELVRDPDIDLVDVVLPHDYHFAVAMAGFEQKKHVLVEKPIAVTSELGLTMIQKAKEAGVKFTVAENTPFIRAYQESEKLIRSGALGDIWLVRAYIHGPAVHRIQDPGCWLGKKPYGGVILDSGVHTFYLFKWFFGGVCDVQTFASKIVPEGEMEDNATITGHLANGSHFTTLQSCTIEVPWMERLEIFGSDGGLVIDQLANPVVTLYRGEKDFDGQDLQNVPYEPMMWKHRSMHSEVEDFVRAVHEDRPPKVDPLDCCYAVRVVETCYESLDQGEPLPVKEYARFSLRETTTNSR